MSIESKPDTSYIWNDLIESKHFFIYYFEMCLILLVSLCFHSSESVKKESYIINCINMQLMPGDVVNEEIVSFERNVHIGMLYLGLNLFNLNWNSNWEVWSDLCNLKLTVVLKLSSAWQNDKKQRYFNFQKISFVKMADKLITLVKIVCRNTAHIWIVLVCTSKWTFFLERWSQIRFCIQGTKIKLKFDKANTERW